MDGRRGRAGGAGEAAGLAGGQRLHEEATRVCPCQLGRRLQGVRPQRGRLAAGRQRDVLRQLVLALLLLFLLLIWGTQSSPDSAWGAPPPVRGSLDSGPRQGHAPPTFIWVKGVQRGGQVGELQGGKTRGEGPAEGRPARALRAPPRAPRP